MAKKHSSDPVHCDHKNISWKYQDRSVCAHTLDWEALKKKNIPLHTPTPAVPRAIKMF